MFTKTYARNFQKLANLRDGTHVRIDPNSLQCLSDSNVTGQIIGIGSWICLLDREVRDIPGTLELWDEAAREQQEAEDRERWEEAMREEEAAEERRRRSHD